MKLQQLDVLELAQSNRLLSVLVVVALSTTSWLPCDAASQQTTSNAASATTPQQLYDQVYGLIEQKFYDSTYNGQNWSRWKHRYDGHLATLQDARKAIETMLASLGDRYTRYLNPEAFAGEKEQIESTIAGIGIQIGVNKQNKVAVIAPIADMPAEKAGVCSGDQIIEVDGTVVGDFPPERVSKLIRGPVGTTVKIAVMRQGKRYDFAIVRAEIPIKSVRCVQMLNSDIGYIRLSTFMSERANEEMREALARLSPARGIIIDLRDNPGGLVTNALDICSMFMDQGIVVSTIDRSGHVQSLRATGQPISHQPLVILINGGSASASEIASGALHDDKRAQLVGQRSFGKGLVQSITRLGDGSGVNITIARYVTPNNTDINKKGITPDYTVEVKPADLLKEGPWFFNRTLGQSVPAVASLHDVQLLKALDVIEKSTDVAAQPTEIKLNPFPNDLPIGPGIGVGQ